MTDIPTPSMITEPDQLGPALQCMAPRFPDIHHRIVAALQSIMNVDGHMITTTVQLAKSARVNRTNVSTYLRSARLDGALCLLGRDMETGRMRYCAYYPNAVIPTAGIPEQRSDVSG